MGRPRKQTDSDDNPGDKRGRFVKLAESRTANAIKAIRLVGNLSNRSHYEFTEQDVRKIAVALGSEIEALKRRFSDVPGKSAPIFKL